MNTHSFILLIHGTDVLDERYADVLYEAGCSDAMFGEREGVQYADFDREAPSFAEAVGSAIVAIESAVPGAIVVRVEPDDLISLTGIAERTGRTKESVRLLAAGQRGPGGFPAPAAWISGKQKIWRWADVAAWFRDEMSEQVPGGASSAFTAALNGALETRWRASQVSESDERAVVRRVLEQDLELVA
jgi:hypothetical protein